jgi:hypothetical protein
MAYFKSESQFHFIETDEKNLRNHDFIFVIINSGVRHTATTTGLLYQPQTIDDCGAIGGMKIGRGNRSIRRTPAPVPLCPQQITHDLTWARTRPPRWEASD